MDPELLILKQEMELLKKSLGVLYREYAGKVEELAKYDVNENTVSLIDKEYVNLTSKRLKLENDYKLLCLKVLR
ncbi:MAG: hypothetical protein LBE27_02005 [Deltaproteobacteria bacterium]|jgi:hypothetical protein|nr:hypothetical protein [Deltaproteobacteria bacterium]